MTEQPEALRLAEMQSIDAYACRAATAAELRRLHADAEESEALRERLSALLTGTAIALRGPATELVSWSWHDLPERAAALVAQRDALLEALKLMIDHAEFWINHHQKRHMSEQEFKVWLALGHESNAMLNARAAIKAVEEGK
jgi:hypothetical protein